MDKQLSPDQFEVNPHGQIVIKDKDVVDLMSKSKQAAAIPGAAAQAISVGVVVRIGK